MRGTVVPALKTSATCRRATSQTAPCVVAFANRKLDGIGYMSPVFSGFTFGAVVAFDDEGGVDNLPVAGKPGKTTDNRDTMYQLGVDITAR